jgi:hypothetical protein
MPKHLFCPMWPYGCGRELRGNVNDSGSFRSGKKYNDPSVVYRMHRGCFQIANDLGFVLRLKQQPGDIAPPGLPIPAQPAAGGEAAEEEEEEEEEPQPLQLELLTPHFASLGAGSSSIAPTPAAASVAAAPQEPAVGIVDEQAQEEQDAEAMQAFGSHSPLLHRFDASESPRTSNAYRTRSASRRLNQQ